MFENTKNFYLNIYYMKISKMKKNQSTVVLLVSYGYIYIEIIQHTHTQMTNYLVYIYNDDTAALVQ